MRITFKMEGGIAHFPGLSQPFNVDTATLEPPHGAQLESMIHNARFFDQAPESSAPAAGADHRTYTITVVDGPRSQTLRRSEPVGNPALQELIDRLQALLRAHLLRNRL